MDPPVISSGDFPVIKGWRQAPPRHFILALQVFTASGLLAARLEGASCRKAEASQAGWRPEDIVSG